MKRVGQCFLIILFVIISSCEVFYMDNPFTTDVQIWDGDSDSNETLDSEKELITFTFTSSENSTLSSNASGVISGNLINVTVPFGTNVTSLVATFTTSGKSVLIESITQISGISVNDFSSAVIYTVIAEDGSSQNYTVSVFVANQSACELTEFSFSSVNNAELSSDISGTITGTNIALIVPSGTDVTALVATYSTTGSSVVVGATTQNSGVSVNDFSSSVIYTVTAEDGSSQNYTVSVSVAVNSECELTEFLFSSANNAELSSNISGTITGTNIALIVPSGTDITALVATFSTTGNSVTVGTTSQISGISANDFSSSVIYTVTAEDGSSQDYTVIVAPPAGETKSYILNTETINFKYCPNSTFVAGTNQYNSHEETVAGFWIGETEVTYGLWYTIYSWAVDHSYTFQNPGKEGEDGSVGANPTTNKDQPVSTINWRDAMIFCNALTEYYNTVHSGNLTYVYTTDANYNTPIRNSIDGSFGTSVNITEGSFDNPYLNPNATGFRLPSSYEWECAAKYIDGTNWTDGSFASGSTASIYNSTVTSQYAVISNYLVG